ncbi:hypothetical protein LCGC14_2089980 [marine sediment metagenome]|uniref:Uncharacterized protein n=1 Tax=marine sediment metagenome TaxID=412755 RepID=A0A0F9EDA7_9ZZZZ
MKYGNKIGWLGVLFGLAVAPPQLLRIVMTGQTEAISVVTYIFLLLAMTCYLLHAVHIKSKVFITAQAINLGVNFVILMYLIGG